MKRTQDSTSSDRNASWPRSDGAASGAGNQGAVPSVASGSNSPAPTMSTGSVATQPATQRATQRATLPDGGLMTNLVQSPASASSVLSSTEPNKEPTSNPKLVVRVAGERDDSQLIESCPAPIPARGDAHAQYCLGLKYEAGIGVVQSFPQAAFWYRLAAEQGHAIAQRNLGVMHEYGRGAASDFAQAAAWYRKAAEQGDACAQTNLAFLYHLGAGVDRDVKLMEMWCRKAANQGYARAQTALGTIYASGNGVERDAMQAVEWYRKAAEQGDPRAQTNLGMMYEDGNGVERDLIKAAEWYRTAAEQGDPHAQTNLGSMYERDLYFGQAHFGLIFARELLILPRFEHAMAWYRKAAEQGYARAQTNLGHLYETLLPIQNFELAVEWYRKAAEQGYARAQTNLGLMYEYGKGIAQNFSQAFFWYNKAAETGYSRAKLCLGMMYANGTGVEKDVSKAAHYLLQGGLKVEAGRKEITFFISGYEEVMESIADILKNNKYKEFEGVTKFNIEYFRLAPAEISAIDRFIRSNIGIRSISISGFALQYNMESVGFARHMADVIQEANTELTALNFEGMYVHPEQNRLYRLLRQNKVINNLREDLRKIQPYKSDELPPEVLSKVIDELIVNSIRGGQTKEATQAAVYEFLISAQFGVMTAEAKPLASRR